MVLKLSKEKIQCERLARSKILVRKRSGAEVGRCTQKVKKEGKNGKGEKERPWPVDMEGG